MIITRNLVSLPPNDLEKQLGAMVQKRPHLAAMILDGETTFTKGGVTYALRGSASESRALVEKATAQANPQSPTVGGTKADEHEADEDPPEPVRLRGESLDDFKARHYRWMCGVGEPSTVVKAFVEPSPPPVVKVNPALQRPETPHAKAARIAAETTARRQAAAGPKPVSSPTCSTPSVLNTRCARPSRHMRRTTPCACVWRVQNRRRVMRRCRPGPIRSRHASNVHAMARGPHERARTSEGGARCCAHCLRRQPDG